MAQQKSFKIPLGLLVLDGLGVALLGLGLAKMFAGIDIVPAHLLFDSHGWTLIIVGALCMLPFMLHFFALLRSRKQGDAVQ